MVRAPLYVHTTTEIRGHERFAENGTSANASRTASSAGLGDRSARVRPKAQSSTSWPCRYHSSVQRSEEHTSELQSPCNLVCRLLLEKKKKNNKEHRLMI